MPHIFENGFVESNERLPVDTEFNIYTSERAVAILAHFRSC